MDPRDYFMMEIWPLLDDEQKMMFADLIAMLSQYAPKPDLESDADEKKDESS